MKRTLRILAAGIVGLTVGATTASAMSNPGASAGQRPATARPAVPAPRPAPRPAPAPAPRPPAPRPATPAPRPPVPPHVVSRPAPQPVNPIPRPVQPKPGMPAVPVRPSPVGTVTRTTPGTITRPNPNPGGRPAPGSALPPRPNPSGNVSITNVTRNSNTTVINNSTRISNSTTTTINVRPTPQGGGRGPVVINNNGPRGPRGPVVIVPGPRVMPGLVGGTVVAGGLLPPVAAADPVPVPVPVPVEVPVQVPAPAAAPNAVANAAEPAPAAGPELAMPVAAQRMVERSLRIKNNTGEKLRVLVQHYSLTAAGDWAWLPADPRTSPAADEYQIEAGKDVTLATSTGALAAHSVRLWAVSESGRTWEDFKNADLTLVPEKDAAGDSYYVAKAMETVSLSFDK